MTGQEFTQTRYTPTPQTPPVRILTHQSGQANRLHTHMQSMGVDEWACVLNTMTPVGVCRAARVSKTFRDVSYTLRGSFRTFGTERSRLTQRQLSEVLGIGAVETRSILRRMVPVRNSPGVRPPYLFDVCNSMPVLLRHFGGWDGLQAAIDRCRVECAQRERIQQLKRVRRDELNARREASVCKRRKTLDVAVVSRGLASSFGVWRQDCVREYGYDPLLLSRILYDYYTKQCVTHASFPRVMAAIDRFANGCRSGRTYGAGSLDAVNFLQ